MQKQQVSLLAFLFTEIPVAIFLLKKNCAIQIFFAKLICISMLILFAGFSLPSFGPPHFFVLFVVGWWMMYHAIALTYNDLAFSKWNALWSLIPIILMFALIQCAFTKLIDERINLDSE